MKIIDKLENERTKTVLEDLESQLSGSENSVDVELRKTKNEQQFFEQIQEINNHKENFLKKIESNSLNQIDDSKLLNNDLTFNKSKSNDCNDKNKINDKEFNSHIKIIENNNNEIELNNKDIKTNLNDLSKNQTNLLETNQDNNSSQSHNKYNVSIIEKARTETSLQLSINN